MSYLRILQVLPELNLGGVERVTLDMAKALRQVSPETFVASQNGTLVPELQKIGGTHISLPLATKNPIQMLRNAFSLAKVIRDHNIHLIHARSRAPAWSALLAARLTKIPLVTTYHGAYTSTNALKRFYNSIMTRGDRVIAISGFILQNIAQHHPSAHDRVRLIPEGIDLEEFSLEHISQAEVDAFRKSWRIPEDAIVFLVPGRITRLKGQTIFIDAIRRLNNPNIVGVILGQNPDDTPYSLEVRRLSEGLPIRLIPHISKPRVAYAAADFIVSPSLAKEAFGRVTAEAGAMERVVIATNHGATTELCLHGKTGLLVPPGDARALADTMVHAIKMSPEEYLAMGKAAKAHIQSKYSLTRMYSQTIDLYKELTQ
jgi:glycosyltransferase involved in cell wall biosynthesis